MYSLEDAGLSLRTLSLHLLLNDDDGVAASHTSQDDRLLRAVRLEGRGELDLERGSSATSRARPATVSTVGQRVRVPGPTRGDGYRHQASRKLRALHVHQSTATCSH